LVLLEVAGTGYDWPGKIFIAPLGIRIDLGRRQAGIRASKLGRDHRLVGEGHIVANQFGFLNSFRHQSPPLNVDNTKSN